MGAPTIRAAAFLFLLLGLAFGASVPFVLAQFDRYGELPMTFWFGRWSSWPHALVRRMSPRSTSGTSGPSARSAWRMRSASYRSTPQGK